MASSPVVTLFSVQVDSGRQPVTLAASAIIHGALVTLIFFGILDAPRLTAHTNEHYLLRQIDLTSPKLPPIRATKGIAFPSPVKPAKSSGQGASSKAAAALHAMVQIAHAKPGPQTLLQPDVASKMALQEKLRIPRMLIWKSHQTVVKKIVAPPPQPATASTAKPSFEAPNREITVSDMNVASSPLSQQKLKILPSTSSPVVLHGIDIAQTTPSTVSQISAQPTPAAVLSLSNMRMEGTATLPPVNESAMRETPGALNSSSDSKGTAPGSSQDSGQKGNQGKGSGKSADPGQGASSHAPAADTPGDAANRAGNQGMPNGAAKGPSQGSSTGSGQYANTSFTEITQPVTGAFSSVVIGNSLQERYPELADVWNGRLAYTVYLHVGLPRSWILQYSLPDKAVQALNGKADRLEAPWPYSIVRPNLPADSVDADALMVHGFVNAAGRFEGLSVVVPQGFPQAQFVIDSLARWQFRPAAANGQAARVEVLLIIPQAVD